MKKLLTFVLVIAVVASMAVTASAKVSYNAAKGTPVIDGIMDDCYTAASTIVIDKELAGSGLDVFATAEAYVVYDNNYLYVFMDVTDPVISTEQGEACWQSDSVEVYVDLLNEEGNSISDVDAGQFTAGYLYVDDNLEVTGDNWAGGGTLLDQVKAGGKAHFEITDKGYTCEMMLPWGSFNPAVGTKIGFTIAINDDADNAAGRENQIFPDYDLTAAWQNTDNYGTLTLTADEYVAPVVEEPAADAPVADAPAADAPVAAAPATADAGVVVAAVVMACAAAVICKKH